MKLVTLAFAAAATVAASAGPSLAGDRWHDSGDVAAAGAIGLLGGVLLGQALSQPAYPEPVYVAPPPVYVEPSPVYVAPPPRVYYRPGPPVYVNGPIDDEHSAWCASRYRSYNPEDNTWVDRYGRLRACQSPFG